MPPFTRTVHTDHSSYSPCTDSLRVTQFPISSSCFSSDCVGACAVFLSCVFFFSGNILRALSLNTEGLIGDSEDVRAPTVTLVNSITSYWTNCVYSGVFFSCSTMLLCVCVLILLFLSQLLASARVPRFGRRGSVSSLRYPSVCVGRCVYLCVPLFYFPLKRFPVSVERTALQY